MRDTPKSIFGTSIFENDLEKSNLGNSNEEKNLRKENAKLSWENKILKSALDAYTTSSEPLLTETNH